MPARLLLRDVPRRCSGQGYRGVTCGGWSWIRACGEAAGIAPPAACPQGRKPGPRAGRLSGVKVSKHRSLSGGWSGTTGLGLGLALPWVLGPLGYTTLS